MGNRYYSERDVKKLITNAGGRCSYNHEQETCKRLLVKGNSVIGEKAHIVAVGESGPRYEPSHPDLNGYDNLMWMCPTHHTIIDKKENLNIFSADYLRKMKLKHERDIKDGNLSTGVTLYDTVVHDFTALSSIFQYCDINALYSSTLDLPEVIYHGFFDYMSTLNIYEGGSGKLVLKDLLLNERFQRLNNQHKYLDKCIRDAFYLDGSTDSISYEPYDENNPPIRCIYDRQTSGFLINRVKRATIEYQFRVEVFITAIEKRYPEILYQPVYK